MKKFIFGLKYQITLKALAVKTLLRSQRGEKFCRLGHSDFNRRGHRRAFAGRTLRLFGRYGIADLEQRIIDLFNYSD